MPSASSVRKEILKALEDHIIPALYKQEVPIGNVTPPLRFPEGIRARLISRTVPHSSEDGHEYPIQKHWPKAQLHSTFHSFISFVYEGAADEHTLVTAAQAAQHKMAKGIYTLHWQAPGVLLFPPGVPRNSGYKASFWEGTEPHPPVVKILQLRVYDQILIHVYEGPIGSSHSLQINDQVLISLTKLFCGEVQNASGNHHRIPQAIFLAMMLRLQLHLLTCHPQIANTSYPSIPLVVDKMSLNKTYNAWHDAAIFIQMHLHEELTLPLITQRAELSPVHLNRLFHQFSGVPVMHYVRLQRISAAKKILEVGSENITEIAMLVGFGSATAFCRVFLRETGLTPNQFRRQIRQGKSTF